MKIAPIDIRQQRFSVKFRGFDPREVDTFLEMVADELEDLCRENGRLKEEIRKLERDMEEFRATESDVKKTLLAAQTLKEELSNNAKKEAELIVRDARSKANEIIGSTKTAAIDAQEELGALLRRKKQLILNMRSMLETHLRMLEEEDKELAALASGTGIRPSGNAEASPKGTSAPGSKPEPPKPAPKAESSPSVFIPGGRQDS